MTGDRMIDAGMIGGGYLAHDLTLAWLDLTLAWLDLTLAWLNLTLAWLDLCVPHLE